MKIVLYVNSFLPVIGGREIVVHYLAKALKELGHDVRVIGGGGWWKNRRLRFGYPVHRYPFFRGFFTQQTKMLQLLFDVFIYKADIINAHATYPAGFIACKLKNILKIPVVITPHGGDILTIPEIGQGDRLDPEVNEKVEYTLHNADKVTAISETIKDAAKDVIKNDDKICLIQNGIDNKRFERHVDANVFDWLNIPSDSKIILTVGNYHTRKGHEVIIRAMQPLLKIHPNARLVIAGANTEILNGLIDELNLVGKVILTGKISFPSSTLQETSRKESLTSNDVDWLAAIYQNSEVYVSGGVNEGAEGLSLALLDGMASGLPVVATNISGNRDIVVNGSNGLLVAPNDEMDLAKAIGELLDNTELHQEMSKNALATIAKLSWTNIARQYVSIYKEACQSLN